MGTLGYSQAGNDRTTPSEQMDGSRRLNGRWPHQRWSNRGRGVLMAEPKALTYAESYRCPACASGDLSVIALMDIFACNFCRHMFAANLESQSVHLADSLQPMAWQWNGWRWQTAQQSDTAASIIWVFTSGLAFAPVAIVALSNYVFPPLEGTGFPLAWTALTLASHSTMAVWLLAEYYRWPWYISGRIRLNRLRAHLFETDS